MKLFIIAYLVFLFAFGSSVEYCDNYSVCRDKILDPNIVEVVINNSLVYFNGSNTYITIPSNKVIRCNESIKTTLIGNPSPAFFIVQDSENITIEGCSFFYLVLNQETINNKDVIRVINSNNITLRNLYRGGLNYAEPYYNKYDGIYAYPVLVSDSENVNIDKLTFNFYLNVTRSKNITLNNRNMGIANLEARDSENLLLENINNNGVSLISNVTNAKLYNIVWTYLRPLTIDNSRDVYVENYSSGLITDSARGVEVSNSHNIKLINIDLQNRTFLDNGTLIFNSSNVELINAKYKNSFQNLIVIIDSENISLSKIGMVDIYEKALIVKNSKNISIDEFGISYSFRDAILIDNSTRISIKASGIDLYENPIYIKDSGFIDLVLSTLKTIIGSIFTLFNVDKMQIFNNILVINSSSSQYFNTSNISNIYLNTTKTQGTSIHGRDWIGGNYWTNYEQNGYSDTCLDSDGDFICDTEYNIGNNLIDYYPLSGKENVPPQIIINASLIDGKYIFVNFINFSYSFVDNTKLDSAEIYLGQNLLRVDPVIGLQEYHDRILLNLQRGNYSLEFRVRDMFGNNNNKNINVELLIPKLFIYIPDYWNSSNFAGDLYKITDLNNKILINSSFELFKNGNVVVNQSNLWINDSEYVLTLPITFQESGLYHYYIINRFNGSNEYYSTTSGTIYVDFVAPDVNVTNPGNRVTTSSVDVNVNFNLWDDMMISRYEMYLNGSLVLNNTSSGITNGTYSYLFQNLGPGVYSVR
ncbi:MAG: NosD domain-containing protein, partial [Candidatus Anstonellales archaeon]